jgi:WD40 repeat protein
MWDALTGQLAASLSGHTLTVCGLSVSAIGGGQLISVSWDKTARIWDLSSLSCSAVLTGHEAAVWAVLPLDDGSILTGSADHTIKKWRGTACETTIKGHTDCVRSLAKTEFGFASAGNDAVIKLWTLTGECIMQMTGHTSFIYSIAVLPTGEIVSSSEDKTARIWNGGECISVIQHAGSVWCVAALSNGDVITGCADAVTRIWTRDPTRIADAATLLNYDQMLAQQTISAQASSIRVSCPNFWSPSNSSSFDNRKSAAYRWINCLVSKDWKCLEPKYIKNSLFLRFFFILVNGFLQDGATKIVRVGTSAIAYAWNASESKWDQIGLLGIKLTLQCIIVKPVDILLN